MTTLLVVENPKHWPLTIPGTEVIAARQYLTERRYVDLKRATVFNLCRSYRYQTMGYYVSLLAAARGHKPLPSVRTIQAMRVASLVRIVSEDLDKTLQRTLAPLNSQRFELSIYFGRNMAVRYNGLCQALFGHFPAPLLRAEFVLADQWRLHAVRLIGSNDIPESHREFVSEQALRYFERPRSVGLKPPRYEMGILVDPEAEDAPSDERALRHFERAAGEFGIRASRVDKDDFGRIAEYDALFIRETTQVNHHTYRFASRAEAEGLIVIDDPESIVRCTNKVYQAELFERLEIPSPRTCIVHRDTAGEVGGRLGFPCILKRPDSSFSIGVVKAENAAELTQHLASFFQHSELVVAQEFVPSTFDWRIGVLDRRPLFACRYHMAKGHWQVQRAQGDGPERHRYGKVDTMPIEEAPRRAVDLALEAANAIGSGLYGVDVKQVDGRFLVMEVNDNPNIESGSEDRILKHELYRTIMRCFYERLEGRGRAARRA